MFTASEAQDIAIHKTVTVKIYRSVLTDNLARGRTTQEKIEERGCRGV